MVRKYVCALAAFVLFAALAATKEYKGALTKIDLDKNVVTVKVDDAEKTFALTDKTQFVNPKGKTLPKSKVTEIAGKIGKKGRPVTLVTEEADGKEVEKDGNAVAGKITLEKKKDDK